jgi:hypothetical protein
MLLSRVGLSSLVFCGLLAVSGIANAHYNEGNYDNYSYTNGVYIAPIPAYPMVRPGGFHHGYMHHHYMHHASSHHHGYAAHHMYRCYYVCTMYVYEVTPMHRDASCSKWKFEWLPMHHMSMSGNHMNNMSHWNHTY